MPRNYGAMSVSRDTLNPKMNYELLRSRLATIDFYNTRNGELANWPHFAMQRFGTHLNKYKFNYLVKGFFLYIVYKDVQNYRHMQTQAFLTRDQDAGMKTTIFMHSIVAGGMCLLI